MSDFVYSINSGPAASLTGKEVVPLMKGGDASETTTAAIAALGGADGLNALAPTVQSTHTASTRTIASTDVGQIIPLSAASNAIAVTIPHTLFAAAGAGRAFVCQFKVTSVAGGAVTFAGSGGIVVTYSGKNPGTTAYAAGDYLTLVVDSATTARVFCATAV